MKIFNYNADTNKSTFIKYLNRHSEEYKLLGHINGNDIYEFLKDDNDEYLTKSEYIAADDFGVDYIRCCVRYNPGSDKWEWVIIPSKKIADIYKKNNLEKYGKETSPTEGDLIVERRKKKWLMDDSYVIGGEKYFLPEWFVEKNRGVIDALLNYGESIEIKRETEKAYMLNSAHVNLWVPKKLLIKNKK